MGDREMSPMDSDAPGSSGYNPQEVQKQSPETLTGPNKHSTLTQTTPVEMFENILIRELGIQDSFLSAGTYFFMVLMYFIQNRAIEGRFALARGLEVHKDHEILLSVMNLADALADGHLEKALVFLRNFAAPGNFEEHIAELKSRLLFRRLRQLMRVYSSISFNDFVKTIGFSGSDDRARGLLQDLQWPVTEDNFVEPKNSSRLDSLMIELINSDYGVEVISNTKPSASIEGLPIDAIKRLAEYANKLDQKTEVATADPVQRFTPMYEPVFYQPK